MTSKQAILGGREKVKVAIAQVSNKYLDREASITKAIEVIQEAAAIGLKTLKGHRTVGGMRASIYNAMPPEGVTKLVDFMKEFELKNR